MVITPSHTMFEKLLEINKRVGSAEGGDQVKRNCGYVRHSNVDCNVNAIYIMYRGFLTTGFVRIGFLQITVLDMIFILVVCSFVEIEFV
jgi:hypothetical protein